MLLNCPSCKSPVGGDAINIQDNIAHCPACDKVFRISDAMESSYNNEHKTKLLLPDGLEVVPGLQLDIKLIWRKISRLKSYFLIGIMFTGMPLLVLVLMMTSAEGVPFFVPIFLSIFLLVGLYFLFKGVANLLNTTYLSATAFELRSEHRPINFLGWKNLAIPRKNIVQLYVERYEESRTNNRPDYAFNLLVMLDDGQVVHLIKGLRKPQAAFYLEHQIEKYLGLEDRPMDGEFVPGQRDTRLLLQMAQQIEKMPVFLQKMIEKKIAKEQSH